MRSKKSDSWRVITTKPWKKEMELHEDMRESLKMKAKARKDAKRAMKAKTGSVADMKKTRHSLPRFLPRHGKQMVR